MKVIDKKLMDDLFAAALASPRKRSHFNLHETLDAPIHRLVMALADGTYIQPHRHLATEKTELFIVLRGRCLMLTFNDAGVVQHRFELEAGGDTVAVESDPGVWHTVLPLSGDTVACEIKTGPYQKPPASDTATWAPAENDPRVPEFLAWFRVAAEGESFNYNKSEH